MAAAAAPTMNGLNGFGSTRGLLICVASKAAAGGAEGVVLPIPEDVLCSSSAFPLEWLLLVVEPLPSCFGGLVEIEMSNDGWPESTRISLP